MYSKLHIVVEASISMTLLQAFEEAKTVAKMFDRAILLCYKEQYEWVGHNETWESFKTLYEQ